MTLRKAFALVCGLGLSTLALAQGDPCANWSKLPTAQQDAAIEAHTLYRDLVKAKRFEEAFPLWEKVYTMAPAADGNRALHYIDGRDIYLARYAATTDTVKRAEYAKMIMRFYDEQRQCYPKDAAGLYSPQVYYMFYVMNRPYDEVYPVIKKAIEVNGNKTDFRILSPLGYTVTRLFQEQKISKEEARSMIERGREIAAANTASADAANYKEASEIADDVIQPIELYIFDCEYFKPRYEAEYRADPDNPDVYQEVMRRLVRVGCDKSDALIAEIQAKDLNRRKSEYEANNPMSVAATLYDNGNVDGALAKYEEIAKTADGQLKGSIYLQMASIYRVDKGSPSRARDYARKAAAARPGWGKPYLMIGDMYASSSRSCSTDPFQQRIIILAALDEYARAKSDGETASTAQSRINKYAPSAPTKAMLFERGIQSGEKRSTGCWIGETVTLP